jgi:hypothetical protein
MLALLFPTIPSLVALLVSVAVAFVAPKGKAGMAFSGCLLAFLGIGFLAIGKIVPRWGGGPPLEGSMATFGSLFMAGFGLCIIFFAFFKRSDDHTQSR